MTLPPPSATDRRSGVPWRAWQVVGFVGLAAHFALTEVGVITGARWVTSGIPVGAVATIVALVYAAALWVISPWWSAGRWPLRLAMIAPALALMIRFDYPVIIGSLQPAREYAPVQPEIRFLRQLAAAQEQFRLRHGSYAASVDSLLTWADLPRSADVRLTANANIGWYGAVSIGESSCSMWVRDSALRRQPAEVEGAPFCVGSRRTDPIHQSIVVPVSAETGFQQADIYGAWLQHLADDRRSGTIGVGAGRGPSTWSTRVGGPLRSQVAVAGNQVFVGAHGNGEVAVLNLQTGALGYRLRAPNWIHHAPVVSGDLFFVGFGNNQPSDYGDPPGLGSEPSGVAAYDRRTGLERWRRYTRGSVMTSPVVADSIVAAVTGGREAIAWRLKDGTELWRTQLAGMSAMGNPLLLENLIVVGLEPTRLCALEFATGTLQYCRTLSEVGCCTGESSATRAGDLVLQVYSGGPNIVHAISQHQWAVALRMSLGLEGFPGDEQWLVAVEGRSGREQWRVSLGVGDFLVEGHHAGTPTVVDDVAYVPSPINGRVIAVLAASGVVRWSTPINTARGSVVVVRGTVLAATRDSGFVALDAASGRVLCRQRLPGSADRAGLTIVGETGILALANGLLLARPLADWLRCAA